MYNNEYCKITYNEEKGYMIFKWKKFCCGDLYRNPVKHALEIFQRTELNAFIIDARDGFEDEKEDVVWGVLEFIPGMAKTHCDRVILIMNEVNDIEGEMDMWSKEFMKYFKLYRVTSEKDAIKLCI